MGIVMALVSCVLCGFVYVRICRRDQPNPLGSKRAVIPVVLGLPSAILSTVLVVGIGLMIKNTLGKPLQDLIASPILRAIVSSFLLAGMSEEVAKFLFLLLAVKIIKPRNVYEYCIAGAGVGFGFTLLEEFAYSGELLQSILRVPFFGMHMVFEIIMGTCLGLARYDRFHRDGRKSGKYTFAALSIPIVWHTNFDAVTAANPGLRSKDEYVLTESAIVAIVVLIISVVLQFVLLSRLRKKSEYLCSLQFREADVEAEQEEAR